MAQTRKWLSLFAFPLIILICSIAGGFYGPSVPIAAAASDPAAVIPESEVAAFSKAYSLVEQNFAEAVKPEKAIYRGAIPGMLRTLDPHSLFFDPRDYKSLM